MGKISIDTPLAEITLRRYEKPAVNGRELVRRVCLSLGLLQPGDSRDVMVDILLVLLMARQTGEELHSEEIKFKVMNLRKEKKLPMLGIASSNIRRQLKRLKDLHLIESNANLYRIMEGAELSELFRDKIEGFLLKSILGRVREYLKAVDEEFSLEKKESKNE
jgi:DNA-binding transcriptional ArsR family regulator